jgi:hypothetical protein
MSENKRKLQRRHIRSYLGVYTADDRDLLGQLVDITRDGVLVITEHPVPESWEKQLVIKLTSQLDDSTEIRFNARCVWCEPDINPRFFASGFEMVDLDARSEELIELLIDKYGLRPVEDTD